MLAKLSKAHILLRNVFKVVMHSTILVYGLIDCVFFFILSFLVLRFLFTFSTTCNSAVDLSEVTGKEQMDAQPTKKGRGRKQ